MRLTLPQEKTIQQGAIFNCIRIKDHEGCEGHGIVITARCDLAHDKAQVINYLPIVHINDWINRLLPHILSKRILKETKSQIKAEFTKANLSPKLIETYNWGTIIHKEFKDSKKQILLELLQTLQDCEKALQNPGRAHETKSRLLKIGLKQAEGIISDLIKQKLGDYYFLDAVTIPANTEEGYVVLLRSIQSLPLECAKKIAAGLEYNETTQDKELATHVIHNSSATCYITGVLRSPDIEHLIQQFSALYCRVGLEDHEQSIIDKHHKLLIQ